MELIKLLLSISDETLQQYVFVIAVVCSETIFSFKSDPGNDLLTLLEMLSSGVAVVVVAVGGDVTAAVVDAADAVAAALPKYFLPFFIIC